MPFHLDDNTVVEDDVLGIAAEIQYRWPNLRIQYLNPETFSDITDAPYRIVEILRDGTVDIVLQVWQLDQRVIDQLHLRDTHAVDVQAMIDKQNALARKEQERQKAEDMAARRDILVSAFKSPKLSYSYEDPDTGEVKKFVDEGTGRVE